MHSEEFDADDRTPLDLAHFALGFVGFLGGVSGIVILSAPIALGGIALFLWSVIYYCAQPDDI